MITRTADGQSPGRDAERIRKAVDVTRPSAPLGRLDLERQTSPLPCIDAFDVQEHDDAEKDQPKTEAHRHAPNRLKQKLVRQGGCGEQTAPSLNS
jgi:hypothetical protein